MERYSQSDLRKFSEQLFRELGMSVESAQEAADVLIDADLRGIDSHGLARLEGYIRLFDSGRANPKPNFSISKERLSTVAVDADKALGLNSAQFGMKLAIQKAKNSGVGMVTISNSNHFGIASYHSSLAAEQNMIGISMTNASPLVVPTRGKEAMLGTNPMCFVFPAKNYPNLVFDMSTSAAANGKLQIAQRKGEAIPKLWAQDKEGNPSGDPEILKKGGMLLPLGSTIEGSSHKGYGFASVVDILSGVLSGANFGPWVPPFVTFLETQKELVGKGIGHFVAAINIEAFLDLDDYFRSIDTWIKRFKDSEALDPELPVLVHGEPELRNKIERKISGIPLNQKVIDSLNTIAAKYKLQALKPIE